jgi:hypothetical protein
LLILQNKINAYVGAIETGDLYEQYPDAKNRNIVILVIAKYKTNEEGERLFDLIQMALKEAGYGLKICVPTIG